MERVGGAHTTHVGAIPYCGRARCSRSRKSIPLWRKPAPAPSQACEPAIAGARRQSSSPAGSRWANLTLIDTDSAPVRADVDQQFARTLVGVWPQAHLPRAATAAR